MRVKKPVRSGEDRSLANQHFPSARYFQIHFQYLHEIIGDLKSQIETANRQIAELQMQLRVRPTSQNINSMAACGGDQDAA